MDAVQKNLPPEVAYGFWLFLESERMRHLEDVVLIEKRQGIIERKYKMSEQKKLELMAASEEFIKFNG